MAERYSPEELELIARIDSEQETEEGYSDEDEAEIDSAEEAEVDEEEEAEFDSEFDGDESEFDGVEYSGEEDYEYDSLQDYGSEEEEEEEEESDSDEDDEDYEPLGGELENGGESGREKRSRTEAEEECDSPEASSDENESDLDEIDGLFCPICTEAWTNEGDHRVCCLPCGHLYGLSCISKWLILDEDQGKCPQCNRECSLEDVRKLFASQIVAIDEKLQKRIRSLEAKCDSLKKEKAKWKIKEINWKNLEANWGWERQELMKPRPPPRKFIECMTAMNTFLRALTLSLATLEREPIGMGTHSQTSDLREESNRSNSTRPSDAGTIITDPAGQHATAPRRRRVP